MGQHRFVALTTMYVALDQSTADRWAELAMVTPIEDWCRSDELCSFGLARMIVCGKGS
jgi:hypothetical protein